MKELDNETGLYYYGARYYASWLGRFIAIDPKQHSYQHLTPYNYVANSPLNNIDPDGMDIIPTDEETAKGVQESINVTFERYSKIASHFSYKQTDDGKYIFNSSKWEDIQTDLDSYKDEIQLTEEEYNDLRAMTVGIYNAVNIEKTIEVTFFEEYGMPIASSDGFSHFDVRIYSTYNDIPTLVSNSDATNLFEEYDFLSKKKVDDLISGIREHEKNVLYADEAYIHEIVGEALMSFLMTTEEQLKKHNTLLILGSYKEPIQVTNLQRRVRGLSGFYIGHGSLKLYRNDNEENPGELMRKEIFEIPELLKTPVKHREHFFNTAEGKIR